MNQVKFRSTICMETSEHNWTNIREMICTQLWDLLEYFERTTSKRPLAKNSKYSNKSHNFPNLFFYDITLRDSVEQHHMTIWTVSGVTPIPITVLQVVD